MKILLLAPFYGGSHKKWVDELRLHSSHKITVLSMPGRHWKWRMQHSAIHFASEIKKLNETYDTIICTDLVNVALLRGLLHNSDRDQWYHTPPYILYFHENQITYPWSATDPDIVQKRDNHYGWINYTSALSADRIYYNSDFHRKDFLEALVPFLDQFPDETPEEIIQNISRKSKTLYVGVELPELRKLKNKRNAVPVILWNHRWEYDKNPDAFFGVLIQMQKEGLDFEVIIAGENYRRAPKIFEQARQKLGERVIHYGYAKNRLAYLALLAKSDIALVTSNQDFYGVSAIEAIVAGAYPLMPDRLAFSEHYLEHDRAQYYYQDDEEMKNRLRALITKTVPPTEHLRDYMMKYDWSLMAPIYDDFLSIR